MNYRSLDGKKRESEPVRFLGASKIIKKINMYLYSKVK